MNNLLPFRPTIRRVICSPRRSAEFFQAPECAGTSDHLAEICDFLALELRGFHQSRLELFGFQDTDIAIDDICRFCIRKFAGHVQAASRADQARLCQPAYFTDFLRLEMEAGEFRRPRLVAENEIGSARGDHLRRRIEITADNIGHDRGIDHA